MLAVAAVKTGRGAKRKAPVAVEVAAAAAAAAAVPKRREPTPDHPPYSWMIGEAIGALGEDGGSAEAAISGFIRDKYLGLPASHDKFLRYYLAKHVAEGLFVCTSPGRYSQCPDESVLAVAEVKPAAAPSVGSPATGAKRGRGRPRKVAGNKSGGDSPSTTPKRRGRGRPRKLQLVPTTDVMDKKEGSEASSTTDKNHAKPHELAPVIANDSYTTPSVVENDDGEAPSSKLALVAKDDGAAAFTTPELVPVPAPSSAPASVADKTGGTEAPFVQYMRRRQRCNPAPDKNALGSASTSISDKKVDDKAVSTTSKGRGRKRELALVAAIAVVSTLTVVPDKQDSNEIPSTTDMNHGQQRELALVIANDGSPIFIENDGGEAQASKLAVVSKEDDTSTLTMPQRSTQTCKLVSVPADDGSAPAPVTDKRDGTEAPSTMHKRLRRSCRSALVNATHSLVPKSIADHKVGVKVVSTTPKGRDRQHKPALLTPARDSTATPFAGKNGNEAQPVPVKPCPQPHKLFLMTADELPDDPMFCLLALPAEMPEITMA